MAATNPAPLLASFVWVVAFIGARLSYFKALFSAFVRLALNPPEDGNEDA